MHMHIAGGFLISHPRKAAAKATVAAEEPQKRGRGRGGRGSGASGPSSRQDKTARGGGRGSGRGRGRCGDASAASRPYSKLIIYAPCFPASKCVSV